FLAASGGRHRGAPGAASRGRLQRLVIGVTPDLEVKESHLILAQERVADPRVDLDVPLAPSSIRTSDPESTARCFDAFPTSCTSRWKLMSSSYSRFCTRVGIRQSGSGDMTSV